MTIARLPNPSARRVLLACLLAVAAVQLGQAALIEAKAWLAPVLVERAWALSRERGGAAVKPWPWADTWPVARLRFPELGVERLVLAGDSGHALAFGPGHSLASAPPGSDGLAVIGGHRDTHFAFLRQVRVGQAVELELPDSSWRRYWVQSLKVEDSRGQPPRRQADAGLLLVTCYPFDALLPGGPLRYTVSASPDPRSAVSPKPGYNL